MINLPQARTALVALSLLAVGGCVDEQLGGAKHLQPLSYATVRELEEKGMRKEDPVVIRIYKEDNTLEVWKPDRRTGRFAMFKTYDICQWSGKLGPKIREGDKQAPEGFYTVTPAQMNPNSSYYLSFNIGFPNDFDRSHGRTGRHLMVHGACSSAGCYAMEDEQIAEIYALARDAFRGGQREFQVQAYPFRMTPANMARHAGDPNIAFWKKLKEGSDHFEATGKPPAVGVCGKDYVFNATPADPRQRLNPVAQCPQLEVPDNIRVAVASKQMRDETAYQVALAEIKLQEKLQQQAPAQSEVIMTASIQDDEGSAAGYRSDADANRVLGSETADAKAEAEKSPADFAGDKATVTAAETSGSNLPSVATAFSGVWGKLVGIAGLRSLGSETGEEPEAKTENTDPITTGTVPVPDAKPSDKSAAVTGGLPPLTPATAFLPVIVNDDPFAIFDFFEDVNGVSVPRDIIRR